VRTLTGDRGTRMAAASEALAVVAILTAAFATSPLRGALAGTAAVCALIGRLALATQVEQAARVERGAPPRAMLGPAALWIITAGLALMAVAVFLAAARGRANLGAYPAAGVLALGALALARVARRSRAGGQQRDGSPQPTGEPR